MKSCSISFKIKDYFPKISSIPFEEYVCLFINGDFNEKIPLVEKDYNICTHHINNVNCDLKYKIHLVNINDFSLVGICEIIIPYSIIRQIDIPGKFIKEQQLKLFTDVKTKRKLFGTIISSGDIYLYISAEVFVNNYQSIDKKKKNFMKNKNNNKKDYLTNSYGNGNHKKYRIIKTDKDSLRNECKTYTCLKNMIGNQNNISITNDYFYVPLSQERKENKISKYQSNPLNVGYRNNLTIDNNNMNNNSKNIKNQTIKKVQTQRKKLTILDLMEQKIQNKKELNRKSNINTNIIYNTFNKTSSPKEIRKLNLENKENIELNKESNYYFFSNKSKNNFNLNLINNNNNGNIFKTSFSPVNNKNIFLNDNKMNNYIYKKKSAQKIRTKISSNNNIFNINTSPYSITNFNLFGEICDRKPMGIGVKKTKSCSSTKVHLQNKNNNNYQYTANINTINDATNLIGSFEGKQKLLDLDKTILEKGTLIRNDFHNQINYTYNQNKYFLENTCDDIYNNSNYMNESLHVKYNRSSKDFHRINTNNIKPYSPNLRVELNSSNNNTNNMTPCSSNQNINFFTQEDLKNNILNLLDFYSLLKKKINIIKENFEKNKKKLGIKKEKFNHQLKKNNRLTQKIISVESKIILHATINCTLNEKIILPIMKIKKLESNIYQNIFGLSCYDYDIMRFKEREKNKLFEEQNIMHLLLIIVKNMIEYYGNISHVYQYDINKKKNLQLLLLKYEIEEKKERNINMNAITNKNNNNSRYNKYNNKCPYFSGQMIDDDFLNKFKIIREVEEEKEYDSEEEEKENNKKENKIQNNVENLRIEVDNDNNININDREIENGATKNEGEKSNNKNSNQYKDNNINNNNEESNQDLIKKILFEEFPKKYPNENKFLYKSDKEYFFGDYLVKIDNDNNNNLILTINNEKHNLEEFEKLFCDNNKLTKEKNKDEQTNGIETTESDKSDHMIREKNENEKKNISLQKENDIESEDKENNYNLARSQKRMKRKISIDEEDGNKSIKDSLQLKNGADSNEEFNKKNTIK